MKGLTNKYPKIFLILLLLWVVELTLVGRSFTALSQGGLDAKLFAYMGGMLNEGLSLYIDIWDIKPPGIFWVNAFAASQIIDHFAVLALIEMVIILGTVLSIYFTLNILNLNNYAVTFSVISSAILLNLRLYNEGGNLTEVYLLLPSVMSILLFIIAFKRKIIWLFLASGFCVGIATLFKLPGLAPYLAEVVFAFLMLFNGVIGFKRAKTIFFLLSMGLVIPWLFVVFFFFKSQGLYELINVSFTYPFMYGGETKLSFFQLLAKLLERLQATHSLILLVVFSFVFVGKAFFLNELNKTKRQANSDYVNDKDFYPLVLLWFGVDLSGAIAGGRFYPHYFLALMPSLCIAAGVGLHLLFDKTSVLGPLKARGKLVVIAIAITPLICAHLLDVIYLYRVGNKSSFESTDVGFIQHINKSKNVDDLLFVWDYKPDIYFKTGLHPASRHLSSVNLWDSELSLVSIGSRLMNDLQKNTPRFIIVNETIFSNNSPLKPVSQELAQWVRVNYQLELASGGQELYQYKKINQKSVR